MGGQTAASVKQFAGCGRNDAYTYVWQQYRTNHSSYACASIITRDNTLRDLNGANGEVWYRDATTLHVCTNALGYLPRRGAAGDRGALLTMPPTFFAPAMARLYIPVVHLSLKGHQMRFRRPIATVVAAAFIAGVSLVQASPAQAIGVHITPVCGTTGWRYTTFVKHNPNRAADFNWGSGADDKGKIVVATYAGTIVSKKVYSGHGYGNTVLIKGTDGIYTFYAHLARAYGTVGQHVTTGARIGTIGQSGQQPSPHLHYEQRTGTGSGSAVSIRLKGAALKYYGTYNITPTKSTC